MQRQPQRRQQAPWPFYIVTLAVGGESLPLSNQAVGRALVPRSTAAGGRALAAAMHVNDVNRASMVPISGQLMPVRTNSVAPISAVGLTAHGHPHSNALPFVILRGALDPDGDSRALRWPGWNGCHRFGQSRSGGSQ